jgi:uncharacterized protein
MIAEIRELIDHYKLEELPVEGTLYKRTYCSKQESAEGEPLGSAIIGLYCDEPRSISLFHKLTTDEVWHFYTGDPLRLVLLYPDGSSKDVIMGNNPLKGQHVQFVIPAGVWQAGHMINGGRYSLYGCTMAPGFTSDIFEAGLSDHLLISYPDRADDITELGCSKGNTIMPEDVDS